ncbi:MAG: LytTR family transcriptional regulator DNA-binding domain-containing protein [Mucispirillum schaedleri]|nr:LytTR family transcriptional regulator DNA-binding domain-containing protein [Mucispirillum schaedleri]
MYKILICDDDINFILELEKIIREFNHNKRELEFTRYYSGEELLDNIVMDSDVLFLDIQLRGTNGNDIAVHLKKKGYQGILVQCSGVYMPTPETIMISPYRYILKQAGREEIYKNICEIFDEIDRLKTCFIIPVSYKREKIFIRTSDIVYFTHYKKGSVAHLNMVRSKEYKNADLLVIYNFQELQEMLSSVGFACPHNSYLVNMRYISAFNQTKEFIRLEEKRLPVARGKVKKFSEEFTRYINQKYRNKLK